MMPAEARMRRLLSRARSILPRVLGCRYSRWGSIIISYDFLLSVPVAVIFSAAVGISSSVAKGAGAVLLTFAGVLVALAAIVIAAHTLLVTLMSPEYLELLKASKGGVGAVSRPYKVVQLVCAAGALVALGAALLWPVIQDVLAIRVAAMGVAAFLTAWGVLGSAQLVALGAFHMESRVSLLTVLREVKQLRDDRSKAG